jgi:hypothetical protein
LRWPLQPLQKPIPTTGRSINGFALPSMHHKQLTSPIVSYLRYFRHRLVRYNWYLYMYQIDIIYRERDLLFQASTKDLKPFWWEHQAGRLSTSNHANLQFDNKQIPATSSKSA